MLAALTALIACTSSGPVEVTARALGGEHDTGDTGDTGAAETPIEATALMELSYHLMHLGGAALVDTTAVLEDGELALAPHLASCAEEAVFDDMVWLEYEGCDMASGWGWVIPLASCQAPGDGLYSGSLAFTFPLFAQLARDAAPPDIVAARVATLARGDDAYTNLYYSIDSGNSTVLTACGARTGAVESSTYSGQILLEEPGDFSVEAMGEAMTTLSSRGPSYDLRHSGSLSVSGVSEASGDTYEGVILVAGVEHRAESGYPSAGVVGYMEPGVGLTNRVVFDSATALHGQASYLTPPDTDPHYANFRDLH